MGIEKGKGEKFPQRLKKAQEIIREQFRLREKMRELVLFDGGLDDFLAKHGGECECIELSGNSPFLTGGLAEWRQVDEKGKPLIRMSDLLNPLNWRKIKIDKQGLYSEIQAEAARLGANAIILYSRSVEGKNLIESGVPVKGVGGFI